MSNSSLLNNKMKTTGKSKGKGKVIKIKSTSKAIKSVRGKQLKSNVSLGKTNPGQKSLSTLGKKIKSKIGKSKHPASLIVKSKSLLKSKSKVSEAKGKSMILSAKVKSNVLIGKTKSNISLGNRKSTISLSKTKSQLEKSSKANKVQSKSSNTRRSPKSKGNLKITTKKSRSSSSRKLQKTLQKIISVSKEPAEHSPFPNDASTKAGIKQQKEEQQKTVELPIKKEVLEKADEGGKENEAKKESPKKDPSEGAAHSADKVVPAAESKSGATLPNVAHDELKPDQTGPAKETAKDVSVKTAKCEVSGKEREEPVAPASASEPRCWSRWAIAASVTAVIIAILVGVFFTTGTGGATVGTVGQNITSALKTAFSKVASAFNTSVQQQQQPN